MMRPVFYARFSAVFVRCVAACIGAGLLLHCGLIPLAGGASEETNARVLGKVTDSAGNAAPDVRVQLVPASYIPGANAGAADFQSDTTASDGKFEIGHVDRGSYTLEAVDLKKRTRALVAGIAVTGDSLTVPSATLHNSGAIGVTLPAGVDPLNGYVFLSGTTFRADLNGNTDSLTLDSVPAGIVPPLFYGVRNRTSEPRLLRDSIAVLPGTIVTIDYAGWRSVQKLTINTTSSGAGVRETVTDFPLLVRLTSDNFAFGQARSDGSDIRFAKADGTPLPFEIESWDASAQKAAIWVRLDTIYGNDSSRSIFLYRGNPDVSAASKSASVFDTAGGFRGVWHLADDDSKPAVRDATGKNDGVMKSGAGVISTSSTCVDGIGGGALRFRGRVFGDWIDLGADKAFINNTGEVSISVWMNAVADTFPLKELINFSKGGPLTPANPESRAKIALVKNRIVFSTWATDSGGKTEVVGAKTFVPGQWYHITGVMKVPRDSLYLYVNGELWGSASAPFNAMATPPTNSTGSAIGANDLGNDDFFYGILDEARIEDRARSPDWIKLSYMNQKEVNALIK